VGHDHPNPSATVDDTFGELVTAATPVGSKHRSRGEYLFDLGHAHAMAGGVNLVGLIPLHRLPLHHVLHTRPQCTTRVGGCGRRRRLGTPPGPANPKEVRHERPTCRVRPTLHRRLGPDRPGDALATLVVSPERIYVDHGLTGTNRERPGLREALAACRAGDTSVVTKVDRLARSLPDARSIADELTDRSVRLSLTASVYDPTDAVGRLLFNVLAIVAEFRGRPDPATYP
jgi:hypothetical protein